ncbi:hypothetical protein B0J14DRAFT_540037 [Halenospora varia]|nr:hypothetical protein B0J14DRAFT_540037 [Halenospora varia]
MPPPVTPSPHRFVIKKDAPIRRTPLVQEHKPPPPSTQPQFKSTPRFHVSSTLRPTSTQNYASATPSALRYVTPARKAPVEQDVDIPSSDSTNHNVHDSIEVDEEEQEEDEETGYSYEEEDEYLLDEPTPKRRRLSSTPIEPPHHTSDPPPKDHSSPLPILSSPPAQTTRRPTAASRFKTPFPPHFPPSTPSSTINQTTQTPFRKPPPFRPPDPSSPTQINPDPLPEQFSPHGKGRKYVPGGLAAELQGWLFNVESSIGTHTGQRGRSGADAWLVRVVVDEVCGGVRSGMTLVRGRQVHGGEEGEGKMVDDGEARVILAGEAAMSGLQRGKGVEVGSVVGIKVPVWEVVVEGERWGVGVEWKALN